MPTFRCEYEVTCDLVLPPDGENIDTQNVDGYTIALSNASVDDDGYVPALKACVVGPAESLDVAEDKLRSILAEHLDLLCFVTHSRFKINAALRLIEWEAGQRRRQIKVFHTFDSRYPPDPELTNKYFTTIETLDRAKPPAFCRLALRYFRYGLLDGQPEDQFMRLWLALEIIAENMKSKDRIPIKCFSCDAAMKCGECGKEQTRVPMAKQAIESLIVSITGDDAPKVSEVLFKARNGLMHGRKPESVEKELNMPMSEIVSRLGSVTWHAIISSIPIGDSPSLYFGHRGGEFSAKSMTMVVTGAFTHADEGHPHPSDDKIPDIEISKRTSFNKPEKND